MNTNTQQRALKRNERMRILKHTLDNVLRGDAYALGADSRTLGQSSSTVASVPYFQL
jgi:hypothetical protein